MSHSPMACALICLTSATLLNACSNLGQSPSLQNNVPAAFGNSAPAHESRPSARTQPPIDSVAASEAERLVGTGEFLAANRSGGVRRTGEGVEFAFNNAPIADVVSALIGDALGSNFAIDPSVNGRITLRAASPVAPADIPETLDQALRMAGARLTESANGQFLIQPISRSNQAGAPPIVAGDALPIGQGTVIVPLTYTSAQDMSRILAPLAESGARVTSDTQRNILILQGERGQLETLLTTIELFDVDWLSGMSFSVYRASNASASDLVNEVNAVMGGGSSPVSGQIELIALERLDSVVVLAQSPLRLEQAEAWLQRLDVSHQRGRTIRVMPLVNADAESLAEQLSDFLTAEAEINQVAPVTIQADTVSNSLLLVADDAQFEQVERMVAQLDKAPDQVIIEARIVEVVLNDDLRYGVQWFLDTRDGGQITWSGNAGGAVAATFPGFAYTYASDFVRSALSAIASVTDVETVSNPHIMALNNRPSTIQVGDQVPVITQSAVSVADPDAPIVNSVEFRDTGVLLNVTPRIGRNGSVVLEIEQEVSSVAETTTSGIDSPTIQQRRFSTTIAVPDGETVALGGLIRESRSQIQSGVPLLQRAPGIGALFSERSDAVRRTELIVFLTPRVVRSGADAVAATQAMRNRLEILRDRGFADG